MGARFVSVDRETPMLWPPDLREWGPEDDLVPFVIEAVDRLRLESVRINHRGTGDKECPPHMMLALLICSYPNGLRDKESFLPRVADSHAQIPKNSENNNIRPLAIKMSCGLREGPSRLTTHRIYRFGTGKVERLRLGVSPARLRRLLAVRSYEKLFCRGQKVRTQFPARLLRPQQRFL
jgi:hypothetical protein